MADQELITTKHCSFCGKQAVEFRTILEELPPEQGEDGELWTQWRPFDLLYLCRDHSYRYRRHRISVKEQGDPKEDYEIEDGHYRTPAGWEYRVVRAPSYLGWIRSDG